MKNGFTTLKESEIQMYDRNERIYSELEQLQKETDRWRKLSMFLLFILAIIILTVIADSLCVKFI